MATARAYDPREYELIVRQEPKQARMCGVGGKGPLPIPLPSPPPSFPFLSVSRFVALTTTTPSSSSRPPPHRPPAHHPAPRHRPLEPGGAPESAPQSSGTARRRERPRPGARTGEGEGAGEGEGERGRGRGGGWGESGEYTWCVYLALHLSLCFARLVSVLGGKGDMMTWRADDDENGTRQDP